MNWFISLESQSQLEDLNNLSNKPHTHGVLLFKHSTRCAVSHAALRALSARWPFEKEDLPVFLLDILRFRSLSNQISDLYGIRHESPQILFIKKGLCAGNASHEHASIETIKRWLQ
jgi:bacillithiol system protein YtxJ